MVVFPLGPGRKYTRVKKQLKAAEDFFGSRPKAKERTMESLIQMPTQSKQLGGSLFEARKELEELLKRPKPTAPMPRKAHEDRIRRQRDKVRRLSGGR